MEMARILGINKLLDRFRRDVKDIYDYHFKVINLSDYELDFIFTAKSRVLKSVFNQVKKTLVRKDTKFTKLYCTDSETVAKFKVPKQFNGRVHTAILRPIRQIEKEVRKDGIEILKSKVDECLFINDKEITKIHIKVGGIYVKK